MNPNRWENLDLILGLLVTLGAVAIAVLFPEFDSPLRIGLGLLLALFVPGYTLMVAFFPGRDGIDGVERLAMSVGFSIVIVPIVALLLNYSVWGIRLDTLAIALSVVVVLAATTAYLRRGRLKPGERFSLSNDPQLSRGLAFGALALVAIPFAVGLVQPKPHFTELYLQGPAEGFEGYPATLQPGEEFTTTIVVINREGRPMAYSLHLPAPQPSPIDIPPLASGESWSAELRLTAPHTAGMARLPLELYRSGDKDPYRMVHLIVNVTPPTGSR